MACFRLIPVVSLDEFQWIVVAAGTQLTISVKNSGVLIVPLVYVTGGVPLWIGLAKPVFNQTNSMLIAQFQPQGFIPFRLYILGANHSKLSARASGA